MKKRILPTTAAALVGTFLCLVAAYNLDRLLSNDLPGCSIRLTVLLDGFISSHEVRMFFLLLWAALGLFLFWILFGQAYIKYRSDIIHVTPDIPIPAAEGQGQYGSAKFLDPKRYKRVWAVATVDTDEKGR